MAQYDLMVKWVYQYGTGTSSSGGHDDNAPVGGGDDDDNME
jgi:hypothetical protein